MPNNVDLAFCKSCKHRGVSNGGSGGGGNSSPTFWRNRRQCLLALLLYWRLLNMVLKLKLFLLTVLSRFLFWFFWTISDPQPCSQLLQSTEMITQIVLLGKISRKYVSSVVYSFSWLFWDFLGTFLALYGNLPRSRLLARLPKRI